MPFCDLVIRDGDVILPGKGRTRCDLAISDGRILGILEPGTAIDSEESFSAAHLVIMPGAIDPHLHLGHGSDISRPRASEDAERETAAAVAGGITCFIPYLLAPEPFETIFDDVVGVTEKGSRIDFGYHFIISTPDQLSSVPRYAKEMGAPTFKIFMNNRGGEGKRLGLPDIDDAFLFKLCELAAANNGMVCPHPENIEVAWVLRDRLKVDSRGLGDLALWNASRPPFVEADAVQSSAYLAQQAGAPLYVVHTSSLEALELGLMQRARGAQVFFETCPHYLTHDVSWEGGKIGKINPPLRERSDCERLWQGLLNGEIDTIGTDHVHRDISSKSADIWSSSPGCPGLETMLPVLLTDGHHKRGLSLERIAQLTSTNSARLMGLDHAKGSIAPGMDADLTMIDVNAEWTLERSDVLSSAGYSIYEGKRFKGAIEHTMVRGQFALRGRELVTESVGRGKYIHRKLQWTGELSR